jgi:F-type H+-transporting ATPase subunit delta
MNDSKISVRYAKALFDLARDKKILDQVSHDLLIIKNNFDTVFEFREVINSPIIAPSIKNKIVKSTFESGISSLTKDFVELILNKKREFYLQDIIRNFLDSYKKEKNIKTVVLTSAIEIGSAYREKIKNTIKQQLKADIELVEKIDGKILGGIILRIDNQQFDSSVLAKLSKIRREIASN